MKYTLTGNFQYDLGIFGLKQVLDYFSKPYQTDNRYFIEIELTPEEILHLVLLKKIIDQGPHYFKNKVIKAVQDNKNKIDDNEEEIDVPSLKYNELEADKKEYKYEDLSTDRTDSIDNLITELACKIYNDPAINLKTSNFNIKEVENIIWEKSVELLNNTLQNFQADKKAKGKDSFIKAQKSLYQKEKDSKDHECTFCHINLGKPISRNSYFCSPSQLNAAWFNIQNIFICPYCIASSLAVDHALIFMGRGHRNGIAVYVSNLQELQNIHKSLTGINSKGFTDITLTFLDYIKLKLNQQAVVYDFQIIEFFIDSQEPDIKFYILNRHSIENMIKIHTLLETLYSSKSKRLWGAIKGSKRKVFSFDISREIIFHLSHNLRFLNIVHKYYSCILRAEIIRQQITDGKVKKEKATIQGFFPDIFLDVIKIDTELYGGLTMQYLDEFKSYGQKIRNSIYASLIEGKKYEEIKSTFNNKIIALSNQIMNSSNSSFKQFAETLARVAISHGTLLSSEQLGILNDNNYKDIGAIIALALISKLPKEQHADADTVIKEDDATNEGREDF